MSSFQTKKTNLLNFKGVLVAAATPFNSQGEIQIDKIEDYANNLQANGVRGAFIFGTTGEVFSLNLAEKITLLKAWMNAIQKIQNRTGERFLSIVNVSSTVFLDIEILSKTANDLNVDAIGILPPIYIPVSKVDDLTQYVAMVSKCVPELPILYYHIPMFTRELSFELASFLENCLCKVEQLSALKFTDGNFLRLNEIFNKFSSKINIMNGHEETTFPSTTLGCKAVICATASLPKAADLINTVLDTKVSLEERFKAHQSMVEIINDVKRTGNGHFFLGLKTLLNQSNPSIQFGLPRAPVYISKQI